MIKLLESYEISDLDEKDRPDYVDAFINKAWYDDGSEATEDELNGINGDEDLKAELIYQATAPRFTITREQ